MSAPDLWAERFQSQALRIQTLEARCAELEAALARYGGHCEGCAILEFNIEGLSDEDSVEVMGTVYSCDCGWSSARAALAGEGGRE